jgi:hypothetical protein
MEGIFTSFEIQRALKKNRSTFQSALSAGHIKGDKTEGKGKGKKNEWTFYGFCSVKAFFDMVQLGRPRFKADKEALDINWSNVGREKDQVRYIVFSSRASEHPNLRDEGAWKSLDKWPRREDINGPKTIFFVIDVLQIKEDVYKLAEKIIADREKR